jgi:hypothetical protein
LPKGPLDPTALDLQGLWTAQGKSAAEEPHPELWAKPKPSVKPQGPV